jgi:protein O-GlcNAc transferase
MTQDDPMIEEAYAHHQAQRLPEAEALYRQVLEKNPEHFQGLQLMGTLALHAGRIEEAHHFLDRALKFLDRRGDEAKRHASLYNNLGIASRALGRVPEAIQQFKKGLALDPDLTELHVSLGGALMQAGDIPGAQASYEKALMLNAAQPGVLCDLGTIYAQTGRVDDAISMYEQTLSLDPTHQVARNNLTYISQFLSKRAGGDR